MQHSFPTDNSLSVTTVIPTVGRGTLGRAVRSVLDQEAPRTTREIIVVNDSGTELAREAWQRSEHVRVVPSEQPRSGPSAARNEGASLARGDYLHFLDDDDWMLPGAFRAFAETHRGHPEARWLYGVVERHSRTGEYLGIFPAAPEGNVLAEIISGEWFPMQATLVERELFREVGGYRREYIVSEDMDLILRLSLVEDLCRVRTPVCVYSEGIEGSETQRERCSELLFRAYEEVFDRPESLPRVLASADTPHLHGKVLRHYLISLRKNVREQKYTRAARRLVDAVRVMGRSGGWGLTPELWRAVTSPRAGMSPSREGEG